MNPDKVFIKYERIFFSVCCFYFFIKSCSWGTVRNWLTSEAHLLMCDYHIVVKSSNILIKSFKEREVWKYFFVFKITIFFFKYNGKKAWECLWFNQYCQYSLLPKFYCVLRVINRKKYCWSINEINPGIFFLLNFIPIVKFFGQFQTAWFWDRTGMSKAWTWHHQQSLLKCENEALQSFMLQEISPNWFLTIKIPTFVFGGLNILGFFV